MTGNGQLSTIAAAMLEVLDDNALEELARRVSAFNVQPALLNRAAAAKYLSISTEALRRSKTIKPVRLDDAPRKPLYRVCDLDAAIAAAMRRNGKGVR